MNNLLQRIRPLLARLGLKGKPAPPAGPPARLSGPPELMSEAEPDGFIDTVFFVRSYHRSADGAQTVELAATHENRPLGFTVVLGAGWDAGSLTAAVPVTVYKGTVTLKSAGAPGNNFVHCLARLYRAERMPRHMKAAAAFSALSLSGNPGKLTSEPVKLKLFHESPRESAYAELYLNLDPPAHRAHLDEKDEDYRAALLAALSE